MLREFFLSSANQFRPLIHGQVMSHQSFGSINELSRPNLTLDLSIKSVFASAPQKKIAHTLRVTQFIQQ